MSRTAVIILNWNGRDMMRRYLPKVLLSTTAQGAEVIVADNGSTDGSLQMLNDEFPSVRVIAFDRNYGFAEGYNKALAAVDHDYAVLLNSDVAPEQQWLEPLVLLMDSDPSVAACAPKLRDDKDHSRFEYAGAAGGFLDIFGYPFCRGRLFSSVEQDNGQYDSDIDALWVSGAALMVRRKLYLDAGGLDGSFFAHMEEIDLCWRLRNMGHRVVARCTSTVYHLGGATLSADNPRKTFLNFRNSLWTIVKNYNGRAWWAVLLARMILDGLAGALFLAQRKPAFTWAIVRAHWAMFAGLPRNISIRKKLKKGRPRTLVPEIVRTSIVWDYYARGLRVSPLPGQGRQATSA